jgi:uncharacterized protein (DUF1778 family)
MSAVMREREKASEDIHMRINPTTKALLVQAAELSGHTSLSGFISFVATQEAKKIIRGEEVTLLSDAGMDYALKLINDPPKPSKKLIDLMRKAKKQSKGE